MGPVQEPDSTAGVTSDDPGWRRGDGGVGDITSVREETGMGLEVPDSQCPVIGRRDCVSVVYRHRARRHPADVTLQGGEQAPATRPIIEGSSRSRPEVTDRSAAFHGLRTTL
jgi:hypothetical protein